jgi:hypothetical protein
MAELSKSENTLAYRIMVSITKLRSFIEKTQEKQIGYFHMILHCNQTRSFKEAVIVS